MASMGDFFLSHHTLNAKGLTIGSKSSLKLTWGDRGTNTSLVFMDSLTNPIAFRVQAFCIDYHHEPHHI